MAQRTEAARPAAEPRLQVQAQLRRDINWVRVPRVALWGGLAAVLVSAIGLVEAFAGSDIVRGLLSTGYALLFLVPIGTGYAAGRPPPALEGMPPPRKGARNALAGLLAGLGAGLVLAAFVLLASKVNIRPVFINVSPKLLMILTFEREMAEGLGRLIAGAATAGAFGGALHLLRARWRSSLIQALVWLLVLSLLRDLLFQILKTLKLASVSKLLLSSKGLTPAGGGVVVALGFLLSYVSSWHQARLRRAAAVESNPARQRVVRFLQFSVTAVVLLAVAPVVGRFYSEVLTTVGIFLLMALGLNIVVGIAGLLDLGYVAFFAVGAYAGAVLTTSNAPRFDIGLSFWQAIPFVMLAAVLAGLVVGTPVLRMRGDYLAIVTLGFGEIARLMFLSDWFRPVFGGAQGIIGIAKVEAAGRRAVAPEEMYYPILFFCLVAAYVSWRLVDSRIGRAWMAIREDEQVAEAMGISIVSAKLSAFIIGAILASFGGALFASKIGSVFPHSFSVLVSITVLVAIIVGGMGHIPGVVTGALVVVALPDLLREFQEFKFLFYGALLIAMMLLKPEGLVPSARRARELHEEELAQDAWLRARAESQEAQPEARPTAG